MSSGHSFICRSAFNVVRGAVVRCMIRRDAERENVIKAEGGVKEKAAAPRKFDAGRMGLRGKAADALTAVLIFWAGRAEAFFVPEMHAGLIADFDGDARGP